nr:pentatricopeptide repeat-containing protein At2g30780-like [Tanacetum cinerariifolium]
MNRVFRISDIAAVKSKLLYCHRRLSIPKPLTRIPSSARWVSTEEESQSLSSKAIGDLYGQFADKWVYAEVRAKEELIEKVCVFKDELLKNVKDEDENSVENLLEVEGWKLFKIYSDGAAMLELLKLLEPFPNLAVKFKCFEGGDESGNAGHQARGGDSKVVDNGSKAEIIYI